MDIQKIGEQVEKESLAVRQVMAEVEKVIVGQKELIEKMMIGLLCGGHLLLEGLPGLAKTTAIRTLAAAVDVNFMRIQFTPDLLPADILGTQVFRPDTGTFEIQKGPIFHNIILADEINRAPAKVQSALLEAMAERQVSLAGKTFPLEEPFMVLATQNPIEQEGTYPLPEAQVDRFMLKLKVGYPTYEQEKEIMKRVYARINESVCAAVPPEAVERARKVVGLVHMEEKIVDYIVLLCQATRKPKEHRLDMARYIRYGASPRASIFLGMAARANAFLNGRGYVIPQDVKYLAPDVLRHRIITSYEAEAEGVDSDDIVSQVLERVEVP
ncbi:MAG: AAA family ATPase [Deltaproteobacteria bacterium]|nr:AAA family ATPase [Deltaproteobacteria bacterium]